VVSTQSCNGYDAIGKARRITDGVFSISQKMMRVHAFLVDDGKDLTLIDSLYDKDGARILGAIQQLGRQPTDLKNIVITHAHRAHVGGTAALKKVCGAKVWIHEWEGDILAGDRKAQTCSFIPQPPLGIYHFQLAMALGFGRHPPCEADSFLREGDRIGPLQVIHIPGHSPGHMAFYWEQRAVVFVGDALATWPEFNLGWLGVNLNNKQNRLSLLKIDDLRADVIAVGHGAPAMGGQVDQLRSMIRNKGMR
jgi:glyoxylase-like metal-dependent hydrolase (beta-lactamase superfamily II)